MMMPKIDAHRHYLEPMDANPSEVHRTDSVKFLDNYFAEHRSFHALARIGSLESPVISIDFFILSAARHKYV